MDDERYPVGHRKPPKEFQFKKGQSGNPGGRKKGTKPFAKELLELLHAKVPIMIDGKKKFVTWQRAILLSCLKQAMRDYRVLDVLFRLKGPQLEELLHEAEANVVSFPITPRVRKAMEFFAAARPDEVPPQKNGNEPASSEPILTRNDDKSE